MDKNVQHKVCHKVHIENIKSTDGTIMQKGLTATSTGLTFHCCSTAATLGVDLACRITASLTMTLNTGAHKRRGLYADLQRQRRTAKITFGFSYIVLNTSASGPVQLCVRQHCRRRILYLITHSLQTQNIISNSIRLLFQHGLMFHGFGKLFKSKKLITLH
jgi:hypothetical protein